MRPSMAEQINGKRRQLLFSRTLCPSLGFSVLSHGTLVKESSLNGAKTTAHFKRRKEFGCSLLLLRLLQHFSAPQKQGTLGKVVLVTINRTANSLEMSPKRCGPLLAALSSTKMMAKLVQRVRPFGRKTFPENCHVRN